jgi:HSP20 family molecular chaperone IbpA
MNASKLLNLRPLTLKNSLINTRFISLVSNKNRQLSKVFANDPFEIASNLMRDLDREFQRTRKQIGNNFFNIDTGLQSLPTGKSSIDPIVSDKDGNRRFLMTFDMKGFTPEEIKVKTDGRNLRISAKREKQVKNSFPCSFFCTNFNSNLILDRQRLFFK